MSADEHESLTISGATMAWDPARRLFLARYAPQARPSADDAPVMLAWMDARAGPTERFDMVVDLEHADKLALAWRFRWISWFYANRNRMRVAIHHADHVGSTIVNAFALSTRTEIRSFRNEIEALAWLREPPAPRAPPEPI